MTYFAEGARELRHLAEERLLKHPIAPGQQVAEAERLLHELQVHQIELELQNEELRQTEAALREADRRKDEFLAMLAHELRNPLVPISNAAHILRRPKQEEAVVRWAHETIERQVGHLTRLVNDLLDVSRVARGKITLKPERVNFASLVEHVQDMVCSQLATGRHRLVMRLPAEPMWVKVDPVRITQVLFNLLDNAAKYSHEAGEIEFAAWGEGSQITIQVSDNGIGIPAELLPHVFDLFRQGERSLDRSQGGLGIGLTLVQRLVEMHDGQVEACSKGPGTGAKFTVRLPCLLTPDLMAADHAPMEIHLAGNLRVLVVDDDLAVADSTAVLLELEGHEVRIANSGYAALESVVTFEPHAIVLDIGMKGMDGLEAARRLRQLPKGNDLFIMAMTGYSDNETRIAALEAGCDHYLVKPVDANELLGLLAEVASSVGEHKVERKN